MEIQIKAYAYTIDIITEIRYFCKCNNAVFGKFRIIFTCAISKTDCSLHHSFHALFKISGNEKFVRTTTLASRVKGEVLSPERIRATTGGIAAPLSPRLRKPFQNRTIPLAFRRGVSVLLPLHRILPPSHPVQKDNTPSPRTTTLASPRKRGGGTADIIFWPAVQYSDSPTFMILKLFRAVTVGIAPHPHHQ